MRATVAVVCLVAVAVTALPLGEQVLLQLGEDGASSPPPPPASSGGAADAGMTFPAFEKFKAATEAEDKKLSSEIEASKKERQENDVKAAGASKQLKQLVDNLKSEKDKELSNMQYEIKALKKQDSDAATKRDSMNAKQGADIQKVLVQVKSEEQTRSQESAAMKNELKEQEKRLDNRVSQMQADQKKHQAKLQDELNKSLKDILSKVEANKKLIDSVNDKREEQKKGTTKSFEAVKGVIGKMQTLVAKMSNPSQPAEQKQAASSPAPPPATN